MNDLFGIDPWKVQTVRDLSDLIRMINPSEGRFIARYPEAWGSVIREQLSKLDDLEQSRFVEEWISRARNSLLPTSDRYDTSVSWIKNAVRLQGRVRALIGDKSLSPRVFSLTEALLDPKVLPDSRSSYISRSVRDYVMVARPLFQISSKIVMLDPYFRFSFLDRNEGKIRRSWRHVRPLRGLLEACVEEGKVEVFRLVIDRDEALKPYQKDLAEEIFVQELSDIQADCGAGEIEMEYQFLDPTHFTDQHPRYLLGNHAGLHFDWGLDTGDESQRNLVTWLSEGALRPLLDRFF